MRFFCVMGSPRQQGNTAKALGWLIDDLRAAGHEVERIEIMEHLVAGCTGCNTCKMEPHAPGCIHDDEGNQLMLRIMGADVLLLASPLYCWNFPAQLKALVDRAYCLKKPHPDGSQYSLIAGKRLALLLTSMGPVENNAAYMDGPLAGIAWFTQTELAGKLYLTGCSTPEEMGAEMRKQVHAFAAQISGPISS